MTNIDVIVGRRLQLLRLLANLSVGDVATLLATGVSDVTACEGGRARLGGLHIAKLAEHFRTPISWFFFSFGDPAFEACVLRHVEEAALTRQPQDIQFLSRISEIVEAMPYAEADDQSRFMEEARKLMRKRNSA